MARTRWTEIDPDYKSDDAAVDPADPLNEEQTAEPSERVPNEDTPQDSLGVPSTPGIPSTPGNSILGSSGSNAEESGEGSGEGSHDEESGSDEESSKKAAPIDEEAYKWPAKGDPTDMTMSARDVVTLNATLPAFLKKKSVGEKWEVVVPPVEASVVWTDDVDNADNYFGCYEAAFTAGLRFPLHHCVKAILRGYDLGVWQLTPNSWVNILGYIAACELQDVRPSWEAFAHMHYLSRAPGGCNAWYTLTMVPEFMMTLDKPSKWSNWKSKFYVVFSPSPQLNHRLRRYNKHPALLGRKCALPKVQAEAWDQIMDKVLFLKTTARLDDGSEIIVPQLWVLHPDWFKDECFLSLCNLSTMFTKGRLPHDRIFTGCICLSDF
ncbi:uncharacterized protein LOC110696396 [Chenopodium quinoa]|uniref:uncharacterized protein LOC110696396 n=1 Tax=Chenopodium quinoa TaxID=63459 RepID=UPI000B78D455|nr:uncharacterized protein LOC110696396 [Chenopodium quinoa]XP_021729375.1 uncharacterized protein LOC110696396 [Chenopodium quinoa]